MASTFTQPLLTFNAPGAFQNHLAGLALRARSSSVTISLCCKGDTRLPTRMTNVRTLHRGWRSARTELVAVAEPTGTLARSAARSRHDDVAVSSSWWPFAPSLAVILMTVVAIRLHEFFPVTALVRPVLLASIGGLVLLVVRAPRGSVHRILSDPLLRLTVAYYSWTVLTAPFALWPRKAIGAYVVFTPVLILLASLALTEPTMRNLQRVQGCFVAGCGLLALRLLTLGRVAVEGRLIGLGGYDPNDLAALMAFTFPLALALTRQGARLRLLGLATAPLLVIALAATGSRGGALALVASSMVYLIRQRTIVKVTLGGTFVLGALVVWHSGPPVLRERLELLRSDEPDYNYTAYTGRKQIWSRAAEYFRQKPITGVGYDNFNIAEGTRLTAMGRVGKWSAPHNSYVQAFVELGAIGGALFIALLATSGWRAVRLFRQLDEVSYGVGSRPEYLAALSAFIVSGYFLSHAYAWPLFGLLGLIALADRVGQAGVPQAATVSRLPRPRQIAHGWRTERRRVDDR